MSWRISRVRPSFRFALHYLAFHCLCRCVDAHLHLAFSIFFFFFQNSTELGEGARRRLQMFAVNFENRLNGRNNEVAAAAPRAGILQADAGAVAERRGLLDDDGEEEIEFEMREKKSK